MWVGGSPVPHTGAELGSSFVYLGHVPTGPVPVAGPLAGEVRKGGTKHARQHEVIRQGHAMPQPRLRP